MLIALFTLCFPFLNELLYLFEIDQQIAHLGRGQRLAFEANLVGDLRCMSMRLHAGRIVNVLVGFMALQPHPKQQYHFAQISRSLTMHLPSANATASSSASTSDFSYSPLVLKLSDPQTIS